ncbi:MAG: PQQ-dependent dehydrogenase, methanol/ethanol family [Acidobacteriia bacterium]|nr:PQQ-dependent dehydrogenase, methanol/ethanol family [Terriglobia bacterium]
MDRRTISVIAVGLAMAVAGLYAPSSAFAQGAKSAGAKKRASAVKAAAVNGKRIAQADQEPGNWMSQGRTYSEQRFSPLKQINEKNIGELGLAWSYDLDTHRGQEATPLVVDGTMYFSTAWSKVVALDAASGKLRWEYDPKVPGEWAINACCDVVNRGVAVWEGKVFVGTLDGRLVALDAATGKLLWETLTIDRNWRYTITGAPRVVKGKVLIGNGGAEMGVRGYVSAYDAATGKMAWRFYTVPGDPSKPFESPAMEKAAKTWTGEWWKYGAGGTAWDAIVYDPDLDLVYIGTGNGSPWDRRVRSPQGGDNLYLSSIVALNPDTGEYVWHYQETPGESWDFTACQPIIIADLKLDGRTRRVLLHAPKNGFFYVLDAKSGELISATAYTKTTWATGVDLKTGRPIETPVGRYPGTSPEPTQPGPLGGHNWQSMSYSPLTGLVYIPVHESGFLYKSDPEFTPKKLAFNTATDGVAAGMPQDPKIKKAILEGIKGRLVAWDPVQQKKVWDVERPGPWNGGILSTAGNLVFEGTASGNFEAYRANSGEKLWSAPAQTGIIAAPISYTVKGEQYVAVLAGLGGAFPPNTGEVSHKRGLMLPLITGEVSHKSGLMHNVSRMLVFKLNGKATLPPRKVVEPVLNPPPSTASAEEIHKGEKLFQRYCSACHGDVAVGGGVLPDLRYSGTLTDDTFYSVVLDGILKQAGMIAFGKELSKEDATLIREYVIYRANQSVEESKQKN